MSLANKITIARVLMIPAIMFFLLAPQAKPDGSVIAAGLFIVAALSDTVDGYLARAYRTVTKLGKFMDPLADKLLVSAALVSLVQLGRASAWVVMLIIAREFVVTGLRLVAAAENVEMPPSIWGKSKTVIQVIAIIALMLNISANNGVFAFETWLLWVAAIVTVVSGVDYFLKAWRQLTV